MGAGAGILCPSRSMMVLTAARLFLPLGAEGQGEGRVLPALARLLPQNRIAGTTTCCASTVLFQSTMRMIGAS